jgi:chromosome segregation ATPase
MGAVEDTRKVLRDFLAPELREIKVRLDVLEKRADGVERKIDKLDEKVNKLDERIGGLEATFDLLDRRSEQRHEMVMMALNRLVDYTEVRERLARLEGQRAMQ